MRRATAGQPDLKDRSTAATILEEAMRHFYIKAKVEQSLKPTSAASAAGCGAPWRAFGVADFRVLVAGYDAWAAYVGPPPTRLSGG